MLLIHYSFQSHAHCIILLAQGGPALLDGIKGNIQLQTNNIFSVQVLVSQDTLFIQTRYPVFSRVRGAWMHRRIEKSCSTLAT